MKIVFFGTPTFAAESLEHLYNHGIEIISIVSAPKKKKGRGKKLVSTEVAIKGKKLGINVLTPEKLDDEDFINQLKKIKADLFIVIAFRMLPKKIWQIPIAGTINLHTSFLPAYRGAAPINRVLINGEKSTGITTFFIDEKIDHGNILLQKRIDLSENITAAQLHNIMIVKGSNLLIETIDKINRKNITPKIQNNNLATHAPKLDKNLSRIDWRESAINIHNLVRGLSPVINEKEDLQISIFPGAWFMFKIDKAKEIRTKLLLSKFHKETNKKFMSINTDNKSYLRINLLSGSIFIEKLQIAGKKAMSISEFLSGNKINENWEIH